MNIMEFSDAMTRRRAGAGRGTRKRRRKEMTGRLLEIAGFVLISNPL